MTIRRWPAALLLAVVAAGAVADAGAQSLLETFRARRAQGQTAEAPDPAAAELESGDGPGGKFALPPGARAERDLAYGPAPAQKLDVYIPEGAKNAPILLMVHGGAWMLGDKGNSGVVANKARHWLPRGYIVVSPNYRMARPPNPLDQTEDVGRALAFVQANAASWGGDGSRVVLMGHSSGAHLVDPADGGSGRGGPVRRQALARDGVARQRRARPGRAHERAPSPLLRPRVRRRAGALGRDVAPAPAGGTAAADAARLLQPARATPVRRRVALPPRRSPWAVGRRCCRSTSATARSTANSGDRPATPPRSTSFCAPSGCPDRSRARAGRSAADTRSSSSRPKMRRKGRPSRLPQISAGRCPLIRRVVLA